VFSIGAFVRITEDVLSDEPLVEGMVGKVVADIYGQADPTKQALIVVAGARKPCLVTLDALEEISESDYGDEASASREMWRERKALWRIRNGALPRRAREPQLDDPDEEESDEPGVPIGEGGSRLEVAEVIRRAEAVSPQELMAIANPALVSILTEWSVGALDVLADELPGFSKLSYARARRVRSEHIERWLWEGVRLYLGLRSFHPTLPPLAPASSRTAIRALFERIDEGDAARRLSEFCLDVNAVKDALGLMASHWLSEALTSFGRGLKEGERPYEELAQYILQLHIVGFQVAYCSDSANHGIPAN
jgi:hypothetical protein